MAMLQNQIVKKSPRRHNKANTTRKTTYVFALSEKRSEMRKMAVDKAV